MPFDVIPNTWIYVWFALVGMTVGSFLNVVIYRLPRGQSVVAPRSRCPGCARMLPWYDNIPVVSYLLLRGRCRGCGVSISPRYPLVELLMGVVSVALVVRLGITWDLLVWWLLSAGFIAIVFLDLDHMWVPDVITVPSMLLAFGFACFPGGLTPFESLLGLLPAVGAWLVGYVFLLVRGKEGLGFGDIKLLAVVGLAMGAPLAFQVLIWGSIQGALVGAVLLWTGHGAPGPQEEPASEEPASGESAPGEPPSAERAADGRLDEDWTPPKGAFPFGPLLVLATFEVLFWPDWFSGLFLGVSEGLAQLVLGSVVP